MRFAFLYTIPLLLSLPFSSLQGCGGGGDDDDDPSPSPADAEHEPNDSTTQANPIELGSTVSGRMSQGDLDFYKFQIPADFQGYKVTLSVVDENGNCFTGTDPNLEILAADGRAVLYWAEDSVENYCPTISFPVENSTSYYARVATSVNMDGTYTLSFAEGGPGTVSGTVSTGSAARPVSNQKGGGPAQPVLSPVMDGEMLVQLPPAMSRVEGALRLTRHLGLETRWVRPVMGGRYQLMRVTLPGGLDAKGRRERTLETVSRARALPGILAAEPNRILEVDTTPDDAYFSEQWGFEDGWGMNAIGAWSIWTGSADTVVAVIDTGHDTDHPDLAGKSALGYDFISNADNAADGDGQDSDPADATYNGHGTHTSGTVAAATDNGVGVAGAGWNVRYMPLRVCGNYGCTEADIIDAISYAAGLETAAGPSQETPRAAAINMSLGGHDYCSQPLQDAISAAAQRGVIVAAAAGNDGEDATVHSPGNCTYVITVGASDVDGVRASFSNYGPSIDVMGPGVSVYSTYEGGGYASLSGTSMATPHVAGLAGLLKDINPTFTFDTVLDLMKSHAHPVDCAGHNGGCGAGVIDAGASVADALERPDDPAETMIVVQAVDTTDESRSFSTVAVDGVFNLEGLEPGIYRLQAGEDPDGDFVLGEEGDKFGTLADAITITGAGEDVGGINIVLQ